jgi:putative FmdB family regulatory protein
MPVYEYRCKDCGDKFEVLRSIKDADKPISCQYCQGLNTQRALSLCYSQSEGHTHSSGGGCAGCGGGSCSSCNH